MREAHTQQEAVLDFAAKLSKKKTLAYWHILFIKKKQPLRSTQIRAYSSIFSVLCNTVTCTSCKKGNFPSSILNGQNHQNDSMMHTQTKNVRVCVCIFVVRVAVVVVKVVAVVVVV